MSYVFQINGKEVYPRWGKDLALEMERQSEEWYFRSKLKGRLKLVGKDFDYIEGEYFDTEFILTVNYEGSEIYKGRFFKTDCEFNYDDKVLSFEPTVYDYYTDVLAGIDKEFDLLQLPQEIQSLDVDQRPLLQIYIPDETIVSNFLVSEYWEIEVNPEPEENLEEFMKFAKHTTLLKGYVFGNGVVEGYTGDYIHYINYLNWDADTDTWWGKNNERYIEEALEYVPEDYSYRWVYIIKDSTHTEVQRSGYYEQAIEEGDIDLICDEDKTATIYLSRTNVYMRYLCNRTEILGQETYEISPVDFALAGSKYTRAVGYLLGNIAITAFSSETETVWGKMSDSEYFIKPLGGTSFYGENTRPLARNNWGFSSIWYTPYSFDYIVEEAGRAPFRMGQAIPIQSAISSILGEISDDVTHEANNNHSIFLYNYVNPVTHYKNDYIFITQKSNVLDITYDQPAQSAKTTLRKLLDMLKNTMQLYWYIDDVGRFKIEHVDYFKKGLNYGAIGVGFDLTSVNHVRNLKPWSFGKNIVKYKKSSLPETIEFNWMDKVTSSFEGYPIEILSKFVELGKVDKMEAGNFTSDIDYMLLNPGEFSKEGFALFAAKKQKVSFTETAIEQNVPTDDRVLINQGIDENGDFVALNGSIIRVFATTPNALHRIEGEAYKGYTVYAYYSDYFCNNPVELGRFESGSGHFKIDENTTTPTDANYIAVMQYDVNVINCREFIGYKLSYVDSLIEDLYRVTQNGKMSFIALQEDFWVYDSPSDDVLINKRKPYIFSTKNTKLQTVSYPFNFNLYPQYYLIKTGVGNGHQSKISVNLSSLMAETDLEHATN